MASRKRSTPTRTTNPHTSPCPSPRENHAPTRHRLPRVAEQRTCSRLPPPHSAKGADVTDTQALVAEAVYTFALCHTVLHVATSAVQEGNSYYGLAIGFTVLAGAVSVGGVSGGAFNPAVAMLSLVRLTYSSAFSDGWLAVLLSMRAAILGGAWIHIAGPMGGGVLAGLLFRITHPVRRHDTRPRDTHPLHPLLAVAVLTATDQVLRLPVHRAKWAMAKRSLDRHARRSRRTSLSW